MKVIILAGGFGTRLSEYTDFVPKPMVTVGGKPILWHIMQRYAAFGHKDFFLALGYKSEVVKDYFLRFNDSNFDFTIDLSSGKINPHTNPLLDWKISLIDTGKSTMTGGRVKRMKNFIGNETFMITYGDGVADINLKELLSFHKNHGKMVTITAVRPVARFGELEIEGNDVISFKEKPQVGRGWINGGFFICEPEFFDYIDDDDTILEKNPLELVAKKNELKAYRHEGFWQCMDTKRDRDFLEALFSEGNSPWIARD